MSDEEENNWTKTVTVKRSGKKKSSYTVGEQDGYYYVAECPNKARVRPGDRIIGINGISSDEFMDEDDANDLIESIRITVVPQDKLEEYDEFHGGVGDDDEKKESGEINREESSKGNCIVPVPVQSVGEHDDGGPTVCDFCVRRDKGESCLFLSLVHFSLSLFGQVFHCNNCEHDNEDLSEDEDGDLVCEECGHVIELPAPASEALERAGTVHTCHQCGEENHDLVPDEDGDLVCQECGHVIPEEKEDEAVSHGSIC
jgi:DNA-directed RNA polymerase subunit RPC12/RpoP